MMQSHKINKTATVDSVIMIHPISFLSYMKKTKIASFHFFVIRKKELKLINHHGQSIKTEILVNNLMKQISLFCIDLLA